MIKQIDSLLNKITMYKLVLYFLTAIFIFASIFSFIGLVPYTLIDIAAASAVALSVGLVSNYLFSKIFNAVTNAESVYITSLIIVLISPIKFPQHMLFLALAVFIAMTSKYLFAIEKRHIFNPAAVAVVITSFLGYGASWWVGTAALFPVVLIGGLILARKIQRVKIIAYFVAIYLIIIFVQTIFSAGSSAAISAVRVSLLDSSLLFFVFVMFVEPQTSPVTSKLRDYYAFLVSGLYSVSQLGYLGTFVTPEVSLLIGNIFNYLTDRNFRLSLILKSKVKMAANTYSFSYSKQSNFKFLPGQYMEWTLPHKGSDSRGVRRFFSLSSSPTEDEIATTVKFYTPSSTYKNALLNLNSDQKIIASRVGGDFTLPKDINNPIAFIAGGVGITPFRSMVKYIVDKKLKVDIILLYSNRSKEDILFENLFSKAEEYGVKTKYFLTDKEHLPKDWKGNVGYIEEETIKKEIPDFEKRYFYISGPQLLVDNFKKLLQKMKVKNIKTDFFPGYSEQK